MSDPRAYYNENDKFAAAWLRNLIADGHIAPGDVDERSIADVNAADLVDYTQCHFFAGIGGWSLALRRAGWPDNRRVWTGSCPCQPFSAAGKQKGFADDRHLWPVFRKLIAERRPAIVFGEQVASATAWLGLVRSDLEALEYAVGAMPIEAASAGADHLRDRYWFVAHHERASQGRWRVQRPGQGVGALGQRPPDQFARSGDDLDLGDGDGERLAFGSIAEDRRGNIRGQRAPAGASGDRGVAVADADQLGESEGREQRGGEQCGSGGHPQAYNWVIGADGKARRVKPGIRLLVNGFPCRVGLLRGFGNAIDPRPASAFIGAYLDAERLRLEIEAAGVFA